MEIKKADSKGRVSGFEPGEYYSVVPGHTGTGFALNKVTIQGSQLGLAVESLGLGTAEEAEMLLNQAMAKKNDPK